MGRLVHKKRIGILGGTFDPIHLGHLNLAQTARVNLKLNRVIFIPAAIPPHKGRQDITPAEARYQMIKQSIADNRFFRVSRFELERGGISYSVNTLRAFISKYPDADLYFIVGSDALPELNSWRRIKEVFKICKFVVAKRPGFEKSRWPKNVVVLKGNFLNVSSSAIRQLLRRGKAPRYLLPRQAYKFIIKNSLYQK
ncbi:MAG: nicotinate-nucleotide adenylyltransferase [Candidatus Omnitrophota bacterium]